MGQVPNSFLNGEFSRLKKCRENFHVKLEEFIKDEGGNPTVEFVLWVPVWMLILVLTVDVSLALYRYSNIYYVSRLTARQVAVRQWTISQAITNAKERTTFSGNVPIVSVSPSADFGRVNVVIEVPINTVGIFATKTISKDIKLVATASENIEPR